MFTAFSQVYLESYVTIIFGADFILFKEKSLQPVAHLIRLRLFVCRMALRTAFTELRNVSMIMLQPYNKKTLEKYKKAALTIIDFWIR